jgi:hypothetical protein
MCENVTFLSKVSGRKESAPKNCCCISEEKVRNHKRTRKEEQPNSSVANWENTDELAALDHAGAGVRHTRGCKGQREQSEKRNFREHSQNNLSRNAEKDNHHAKYCDQ